MNGLAAIALLLAVASSSTHALKCYSCGSARLKEDFKANPEFKGVFDRRPLNFTDQCDNDLIEVGEAQKYLESCPKGDSCLRFTFRHTAKDYEAVVRGCTQRILLEDVADLVGVEELGCHEFMEEAFGKAQLCTCKIDGCNGNNAASVLSASLFATLLVALSIAMS
uniref:Protein sleepless n=1 Tax=Plectus sambesii TaxID=2011161 RepID=A0A914VBS3_9BILA